MNEMGKASLEEIVLMSEDKEFVNNLSLYFSAMKCDLEQYIDSINSFKKLSEYKKTLIKARLNYIIDKNTPLPHLTPIVTAFFATVNLFPLLYSAIFELQKYQYFIAILISCCAVLYLLRPYTKEKKLIAKSKYLLNLLNI